jgi:hypothetical protein
MKWFSNTKILLGLVIIFTGFNIWLMYDKINLQRQVNRLQVDIVENGNEFSVITEPVEFYGPEISSTPVRLVAIFTDYGCGSCVVSEIEYLNKWQDKFNNTIQVYYEGETEKYLEEVGADFKYRKVNSAQELFSISLPIGNPIIALVDEGNNVHSIHTNDLSRPGSDRRRSNFYNRMQSLFESIY